MKYKDDLMSFKKVLRYLKWQNKWLNLKGAVYYDKKDIDICICICIFWCNRIKYNRNQKHEGLVFSDIFQTRIMWSTYF